MLKSEIARLMQGEPPILLVPRHQQAPVALASPAEALPKSGHGGGDWVATGANKKPVTQDGALVAQQRSGRKCAAVMLKLLKSKVAALKANGSAIRCTQMLLNVTKVAVCIKRVPVTPSEKRELRVTPCILQLVRGMSDRFQADVIFAKFSLQ